MTAISGSAAAVTGAASGIGRALAIETWPRAAAISRLPTATRPALRPSPPSSPSSGRKVTTHRVDVGEPAQIEAFAQAATAAHPALNILINNAGVALLGQFNEIDQAQIDWLMNINFWGVVHGTRAFLPHLSSAAGGAYRQHLLDLRHHRAARPDRLLRRRNSRCAAFPRPAPRAAGWPRARSSCRSCIPAASPPTSCATCAPASPSPTMPAASKSIERFDNDSPRPRRRPPRRPSSRASRRTRRAS